MQEHAKPKEEQVDLNRFLGDALKLAEQADRGRKIETAAKGGYVKPQQYVREVDAAYDQRIREMAMEIIVGIWNTEKRDASLKEIFDGVSRKIDREIELGDWPRIWFKPSKRTVDRRVGELHELDSTKWGRFDCPPTICLKAGYARPNPMIFDDSVRTDIATAASV